MSENKDKRDKLDALVLAGAQKHFAANATLKFDNADHPLAEVTGALQKRIASGAARVLAETAFHAAVQADDAAHAETKPLIDGFEGFVRATFGSDVAALGDFGLKPHRRRVVKPKVKAAAADRAKATRELRGTKGKKQREEIKAAAEAPAAAPTPAAPPAGTPNKG